MIDTSNVYADEVSRLRDMAKDWMGSMGVSMMQLLPEWKKNMNRICIPEGAALGFDHNTLHGGAPYSTNDGTNEGACDTN